MSYASEMCATYPYGNCEFHPDCRSVGSYCKNPERKKYGCERRGPNDCGAPCLLVENYCRAFSLPPHLRRPRAKKKSLFVNIPQAYASSLALALSPESPESPEPPTSHLTPTGQSFWSLAPSTPVLGSELAPSEPSFLSLPPPSSRPTAGTQRVASRPIRRPPALEPQQRQQVVLRPVRRTGATSQPPPGQRHLIAPDAPLASPREVETFIDDFKMRGNAACEDYDDRYLFVTEKQLGIPTTIPTAREVCRKISQRALK